MSDRRSIIVGSKGQDGQLLTGLLLERGDTVLGVSRDATTDRRGASGCRLEEPRTIHEAVRCLQPTEIYYLAAHHASSQAVGCGDIYEGYLRGTEVNVLGVLHFLEAIRRHSRQTRLFYASSCLIFGNEPAQTPQDEHTPRNPQEPYALAKMLSGEACRDYRRQGVFASVGILYNHESVLRRAEFLSTKIVRAAVVASRGPAEPLLVGDLESTIDWGYAPDFVDAFTRILALDEPNDYVVATGVGHTVRDFLASAFGCLGLDWERHVRVNPAILSRPRAHRVGNPARLKRHTHWQPSQSFEEMVASLVTYASQKG